MVGGGFYPRERRVYTNKFFHLPALYVYLLAAVLLVTAVFHAAGLLRQGLYLMLALYDTVRPITRFSSDIVHFTPAAESYLNDLAAEQARRTTTAGLIRDATLFLVSLSAFAWFWRRTGKSQQLEMDFTVRNFYFCLVSGIAFLIMFYSLSAGAANLAQQSVDGEWHFHYDIHHFHAPKLDGQQQPRTVDVDEVKRNLEVQRKEAEAVRMFQNRQVVDQFTVTLVALPVFWLHDRRFGF